MIGQRPWGVIGGKGDGSCRNRVGVRHSSLAEGEFKGKPVLLVCVRCFGQRPTHSRAFLRAGHLGLSVRQPGQSKTLMLFQGCSELLGAASNHY